ncbi:Phospholipase_D-nuclease N-terminal [Halolactibacillus halophilus]|uniref:Negative regulatory protein YxlE n=1 Tax=Halolactibacillus halophilus TaxID=306540 RepID=A0A1I5N322_9BACI|nr:PLD nuclease N-terminal domain-containing protein [Halolactibacillus halophilus]GEM01090.1 negative regulatory protein YxlE [Halolactibacillus halophilus]SFP15681.1 Phospholipase_D-nuclease N-terminal [Halolactibacillus halophilus]
MTDLYLPINIVLLLLPLILLQFILTTVAVMSWYKADQDIRLNGNKWGWLMIILLISTLGPILFFIFGRRQD